jgi:hypothetical protein
MHKYQTRLCKCVYLKLSLTAGDNSLTTCSTALGNVLLKYCKTFCKLSNHSSTMTFGGFLSQPGAQRPLFVTV